MYTYKKYFTLYRFTITCYYMSSRCCGNHLDTSCRTGALVSSNAKGVVGGSAQLTPCRKLPSARDNGLTISWQYSSAITSIHQWLHWMGVKTQPPYFRSWYFWRATPAPWLPAGFLEAFLVTTSHLHLILFLCSAKSYFLCFLSLVLISWMPSLPA